jgi:hypothetical protein
MGGAAAHEGSLGAVIVGGIGDCRGPLDSCCDPLGGYGFVVGIPRTGP